MSEPISATDWRQEGERRFGPDPMNWRFVCPCCGYIATPKDWQTAGAKEGEVAFSCVGRRIGGKDAFDRTGPGPCNYAGGGLFRLNPVRVIDEQGGIHQVFAFAETAS
jgi:hypothetical protein